LKLDSASRHNSFQNYGFCALTLDINLRSISCALFAIFEYVSALICTSSLAKGCQIDCVYLQLLPTKTLLANILWTPQFSFD